MKVWKDGNESWRKDVKELKKMCGVKMISEKICVMK